MQIPLQNKCILHVRCQYLTEQMYSACTLSIPPHSKCMLQVRCKYRYRANVFRMYVANPVEELMYMQVMFCTCTRILFVANTVTEQMCSAGALLYLHFVLANTITEQIYSAYMLPIPLQSKCVLQILFFTYICYVANTVTEQIFSAITVTELMCSVGSVLYIYLHFVRCQNRCSANVFCGLFVFFFVFSDKCSIICVDYCVYAHIYM